ncbi:putative Exosome complex component RRP4 [Blattamonas nauphoetae]|uniref:Exosome complex component RRP4 n=1 Tax=Blattamonas nauphoetae TaxID=2049346 RepID=A0ABQ9XP30_9EUKA|nr:putative Exosome complex component RRP4 [Blattamonas nauphoetae]
MSETIALPGEIIDETGDFVNGHGTRQTSRGIVSTILGTASLQNKFLSVKPLRTNYQGEVGDVVVGRVVEIVQHQWKIDVHSKLFAGIKLGAINLPGNELRIKDATDELNMRGFLQEGDLISAEVQKVHADGSLALHSRNLLYGRLENGILVKVASSLIVRTKQHFFTFSFGVKSIFGLNGYIWLSPSSDIDINQQLREDYAGASFIPRTSNVLSDSSALPFSPFERGTRLAMARLRNILLLMNSEWEPISPQVVEELFNFSHKQKLEVIDLLNDQIGHKLLTDFRAYRLSNAAST